MNGSYPSQKATVKNMPGTVVDQQQDKLDGKQAKKSRFYIAKRIELVANIPIFLYRQLLYVSAIRSNPLSIRRPTVPERWILHPMCWRASIRSNSNGLSAVAKEPS